MAERKNTPVDSGRVVAGVLAVAVLTVLAALNSYQVSQANAIQFADPYGAALAETRFAAALEQLPRDAVLAYVSDMRLGELAGTTAYLAAQYALAPRMVIPAEENPAAEWAVGNFSKPSDYAAAGAKIGFTMVRDFGSGVIVYRKAKP
jgi:hypothetical protein